MAVHAQRAPLTLCAVLAARACAGSSLPFDGQTTYNSHYLQHQMPERHTHQPHQFQPSPAPFDGARRRCRPHRFSSKRRGATH